MRVSLITLLLLLTACGTHRGNLPSLASQGNALIAQGYSTVYADAYMHGCASARNVAGFSGYEYQKDDTLYRSNSEYPDAWHRGYRMCRVEPQEHARDREYFTDEKLKEVWDELKK